MGVGRQISELIIYNALRYAYPIVQNKWLLIVKMGELTKNKLMWKIWNRE